MRNHWKTPQRYIPFSLSLSYSLLPPPSPPFPFPLQLDVVTKSFLYISSSFCVVMVVDDSMRIASNLPHSLLVLSSLPPSPLPPHPSFPHQGERVYKVVFILFFQGDQLRSRVRKICEGYVFLIRKLPHNHYLGIYVHVARSNQLPYKATTIVQQLPYKATAIVQQLPYKATAIV